MPRRSILSAAERESLLALLDAEDELIRMALYKQSIFTGFTGNGMVKG